MNIRSLLLMTVGISLTACVSIPADRGSAQSVALLKSRSAVAMDVKLDSGNRDADEPITQSLDTDATVRIALTHNARMRALYAQLGLAQAEVYDASRLSNPSLGFMHLSVAQNDATRTTWSLSQNFTELLFLHYRTQLGRTQVLQAQQRVAQAVLELEAEVRTAYYNYVVAKQVTHLHEQVNAAAEVAADYAKSLFDAGNISELQLSREQASASQEHIALKAMQTAEQQKQAVLMTLMGLSLQVKHIAFVERLEAPTVQVFDVTQLENQADQQRMDLLALREQANMLSAVQTHTRHWFWLNDAQLQFQHEDDIDGSHLGGAGGSVGVPLFNQGGGARLRAQAQLEATQAELAQLQLSINNDLAVQVPALARAQQVVEEYRQRLIPLQERALVLTQQQQNYMFIGTFELLNAKREALQSYQDYLSATGEYWLRYVQLSKTVGGRLPELDAKSASAVSEYAGERP